MELLMICWSASATDGSTLSQLDSPAMLSMLAQQRWSAVVIAEGML